MNRASLTVFILAIAMGSEVIASPFADPTKPYDKESPKKTTLQSNLFSNKIDEQKNLAIAQWPVSFIKIYPNQSHKNWAIIDGRRVGVGSEVFGGQVISLSKKRLDLRSGHKRRALILLECENHSISKCGGMYYIVE
ncbi:MAG: hypothetical protein HQL69_18245 [Magnetococcales bacterium]|nr:hypothetical protein [Magnetococcales bacterium]